MAIARDLDRVLAAVRVRIDSIEHALRRDGIVVHGKGDSVAHAVADDNLRVGRVVVADCVNPWPVTRAGCAVAERTDAQALDVEVMCSDVMNTDAVSKRGRRTSLDTSRLGHPATRDRHFATGLAGES